MPLILAVEPDRRQAAKLAVLARGPLHSTELLVVDTADEALRVLANRVPELLLTSLLLSAKDDAALAERLRDLDAAGHQVQTLVIPVFAAPARRLAAESGIFALLGKASDDDCAPNGCQPAQFAAQVNEYLERLRLEREDRVEAAEPYSAAAEYMYQQPRIEPPYHEVVASVPAEQVIVPEPLSPESVSSFAQSPEPWEDVIVDEPAPEPQRAVVTKPKATPKAKPKANTIVPRWTLDDDPEVAKFMAALHGLPSLEIVDILNDVVAPPPAAMRAGDPDEASPEEPVTHTTAATDPAEASSAPPVKTLKPARGRTPVAAAPPRKRVVSIRRVMPIAAPEPQPDARTVSEATAVPAKPVPPVKVSGRIQLAPPPAPVKTVRPVKKNVSKGPRPIQDEWGFFDPDQCGFPAVQAKLEEIDEFDLFRSIRSTPKTQV
jgi:hypothetical protein